MNTQRLILASTSPSRKTLLARLQIPFECVAPGVDETPLANEKPEELVLRLAKEKAQAVAKDYSDALIIGADQVGVVEGVIVGKPLTHEQAVKQLIMMSDKRIRFFIGLCLLNTKNNTQQLAVETYDVIFRQLSLAVIEEYLQKESVLNCAGSCNVEGLGISLIEKLEGDDYTALIGLPLIRLVTMLQNVG